MGNDFNRAAETFFDSYEFEEYTYEEYSPEEYSSEDYSSEEYSRSKEKEKYSSSKEKQKEKYSRSKEKQKEKYSRSKEKQKENSSKGKRKEKKRGGGKGLKVKKGQKLNQKQLQMLETIAEEKLAPSTNPLCKKDFFRSLYGKPYKHEVLNLQKCLDTFEKFGKCQI